MDVSKIRINGARILVKEYKMNDETETGFIVPNRSKQQTNRGKVLLVGDGAMLENGVRVPVNIKVGETVIYSSFSGSPVKENEKDPEEYLILNERDVLCVLEE